MTEAWESLMSAPWGSFTSEAIKAKRKALAAYAADWQRHPANPENQPERIRLTSNDHFAYWRLGGRRFGQR